MALFQIQIDEDLKKAIHDKANDYGVTASSLVRIVLVQSFLKNKEDSQGNIFNAERDNLGKGLSVDDLLAYL